MADDPISGDYAEAAAGLRGDLANRAAAPSSLAPRSSSLGSSPLDPRPSPLLDYVLRLADNGLVLAQRLGEWVGKGPVLEEDIASTNVALDLLGQARLWLAYAGEIEGREHPPGR
ncbi:MAG: Phenylacetic acid catabolic protein, partial [Rudaea sp.]